MDKKNRIITIPGENITVATNDFISDWLRNRNTVEYLGIWERMYNPDFNYGEFAAIKSSAGLNSYKISVKEWVAKTRGMKAYKRTERRIATIISAIFTEKLLVDAENIGHYIRITSGD